MLSAKGPASPHPAWIKPLKQVLEMQIDLLRPEQTLLKRNSLTLSDHPAPQLGPLLG